MDPTEKGISDIRKKTGAVLRLHSTKPAFRKDRKKDKREEKPREKTDDTKKVMKKEAKVKKTKAKLRLAVPSTRVDTKAIKKPTLSLRVEKPKKKKTPDYLYTEKLLEGIEKKEYIKKEHIYSYPIHDELRQDFDSINPTERTSIFFGIYYVNKVSTTPFLQYLLYKYPSTYRKPDLQDNLIFPFIPYKGSSDILTYCAKFIKKIIPGFDTTIKSDGFIERGNSIYMFYNIGDIDYDVLLQDDIKGKTKKRDRKWWWTMIYEIVNIKKNINFPIHSSVTGIFLKYKSLNYLLDESETPYEIPNVGYHGTYYTLAPLIETFGIQSSKLNSMYGAYYYFGSFRKAVRYAGWTSTYKPRYVNDVLITDEDGKYVALEDPDKGNPGAIIKFALFLGKVRPFLNHPDDPDDLPKEEVEELKSTNDKGWKYITRKMHDYTGKWAVEHNSAYGGAVVVSTNPRKGEVLFMSNPEMVVSDFNQQLILGSYLLDKTTLQDNWDPTYEYYNII